MSIKDFKNELLKDEQFREEYFKNDLAFEISEMIIDLRIKFGLTQAKLAKMVHTQQSSIARLERGNYLPSLNFLSRIAKALNTDLIPPKFNILIEEDNTTYSESSHLTEIDMPLKSSYTYTCPNQQLVNSLSSTLIK